MRSESDSEVEPLGLRALRYYARSFPVSKGKERVVSLLWKPLSFGRYKYTVNLHNSAITVTCDITQLLQRHLYFWGSYELEHCEHWKRLARRSQVIFDVGANLGLYSLLAAEANPMTQIHSFEPTPEILARLKAHLELNQIDNVKVNALGVGSHTGRAVLREDLGSAGINDGMNFMIDSEIPTQESDRLVSLTSLDDYCRQHDLDRIDLVKMDIEGGEYQALLGARRLLQTQSIGCLFIELAEWAASRSGHSTLEIKTLLEENGYQLHRLTSRGLIPLNGARPRDGENAVALAPDFKFA
jgi:FkbM family methyltransferase